MVAGCGGTHLSPSTRKAEWLTVSSRPACTNREPRQPGLSTEKPYLEKTRKHKQKKKKNGNRKVGIASNVKTGIKNA